jgi:hypothetical protein
MAAMTLESSDSLVCPLCQSGEHVRRLLFFTYCANPIHTHKKGDASINTILEFRYCVVHGQADGCVPVAGS